ncbi:phage Gp37/Gp68 family protein [Hymenobacter gummosus]|uniref:Phage Gp37/Gp68 family protein n=1 Tax=Hymenobacter gummosus TaxID=1776032 RepID=A0A431U6S0_9BACT|nr:phage Gp37/Gp68 family protein [Hymenobacter gummosus]RTQ52378.1 phage Gp37/Gp68 family protein [Hymenobacter gummosus]
MSQSSIEWTEMTWNPTTGCTKISAGCKYCYAEVMAKRLVAMGVPKYAAGFEVATHEDELARPYTWKAPRTVFVNSMSDLFHPKIPFPFIQRVFRVMQDCPRHTFQVLTKRGELLEQYGQALEWPGNVWMGVSVENQKVVHRIDHLRRTPAQVRFLSLEPLLGPLPDLDLAGIHWVIVGGESGPKARPIKEEWVLDIQRQCARAGVAFFFKQWGGKNKKQTGRLLGGQTYDEMPTRVAAY